jgi:hypothetical protein
MPSENPYEGLQQAQWARRTDELIAEFPLDMSELVEVSLASWEGIFTSEIGASKFRIGVDIFPTPQIMAFFLHELIPLELQRRYPDVWRRDASANEKDLVYLPDHLYSSEIKCSSHASKIFGNRSYAQPATTTKKTKSGYYLAINFEKFTQEPATSPTLTLIRFGWLDHTDWRGQAAATGQQASVVPASEQTKLRVIWRRGMSESEQGALPF